MIRYLLKILLLIIVTQTCCASIGVSVSQYDHHAIEYFVSNQHKDYAYDGFERLASTRYPEPAQTRLASSSDRENFSYDENGNLKIWQRRSGDTLEYDYDALNRVIEKRLPTAPNDNVSYHYDLLSRLTTQTLTNTVRNIGYLYDQANRITAVTQGTRTVNYQYDPSGNRTRMTWPDGFFVDYSYDAANRLETLAEPTSTLVSYQYDALNLRKLSTLGNTTSTSYNYTSESRLQDLTHDLTGTAEDISINHRYNQVGQIISRTTSNDLYDWTPTATITNNYTTNGLNQYTDIEGISQQHDNQGNLQNDGQWTLQFDLENRLKSAIKTGNTVSYQYNAENQRLEKNHNGTVLHYFYDGSDLIAVYDNANNLIQRYVHGSRVDEPLVSYDYDTQGILQSTSWYYTDHQGSVIAAANTSGSANQIYTYSPFGKPGQQGTSIFRYTGQVWDKETQLAYYKARYYSPERGRFLSTDPAGFIDSLNLYGYVVNDPVNFIDPSGLAFAAAQNQVSQTISLLGSEFSKTAQALNDATANNDFLSLTLQTAGASSVVNDVADGNYGSLATSAVIGIATKGFGNAAKGLGKFDPNKVAHVFGQSKHNLDGVVKTFGSPEKAFGALQDATQAAVKNEGIKGVFETAVKVGGETVTVRGNVIDGVVKIGTAFK